jgi:signal transduction histidine kinase
MNIKFRSRVSLYFVSITSLLILVAFFAVYFVVYKSVYYKLDETLTLEAEEVKNNVIVNKDEIIFNSSYEWFELEHGQLESNPVYVEVVYADGKLIDKTPNLLNQTLYYDPGEKNETFFNTSLSGMFIRQFQVPVKNPDNKIEGYILIATSLGEYELVLYNLRWVLIISFPFVIVILFFFSKYFSGKSISPVNNVINIAEKITRENLQERIKLPGHKDEIYTLVNTINNLLDRLEDSIIREKQFTSDASHELKTPLSIIKGTLEVLIRKPRETSEYVEKINYCVKEVDRISSLLEQLLLLARYDRENIKPNIEKVDLSKIISSVIYRHESLANEKNIKIVCSDLKNIIINADMNMTEVIIDNIYSNALKYTQENGRVSVELNKAGNKTLCTISDNGPGMSEENLNKIFDRFYRIDESRNSEIKGYGLGLSIVKKLADIQDIRIEFESKVSEGTKVTLYFN